jgi:hypothetical protein
VPIVQFAGLGRGLTSADKAGTGIPPTLALALDETRSSREALPRLLLAHGEASVS